MICGRNALRPHRASSVETSGLTDVKPQSWASPREISDSPRARYCGRRRTSALFENGLGLTNEWSRRGRESGRPRGSFVIVGLTSNIANCDNPANGRAFEGAVRCFFRLWPNIMSSASATWFRRRRDWASRALSLNHDATRQRPSTGALTRRCSRRRQVRS